MTEESQLPKHRGARPTRAKRRDAGHKIVVRLTDDEHQRLMHDAGTTAVSTYVRNRLFEGQVRSRDVYSRIAALHIAGRKLQARLDTPGISTVFLTQALDELRAAILRLSKRMPTSDPNGDTDR